MLPKIGTKEGYSLDKGAFLSLPQEVLLKIEDIIDVLDSAYGEARNIMTDLGGFVQVVQTFSQWKQFVEDNYIDKDLYEFVEAIEGQYLYVLYVVSADYSIAVIAPKYVIDIELSYE